MDKPSKRSQLLAHLKLRDVPVVSFKRLLNLTPTEADCLIANMERDGLIEIKRYPAKIDPQGKCNRIALKPQEQKSA